MKAVLCSMLAAACYVSAYHIEKQPYPPTSWAVISSCIWLLYAVLSAAGRCAPGAPQSAHLPLSRIAAAVSVCHCMLCIDDYRPADELLCIVVASRLEHTTAGVHDAVCAVGCGLLMYVPRLPGT